MPIYTLVISSADGRQSTTLSDFPDDRTAIADTGAFMSAEHPSVAVARGSEPDLEFLGAWDWSEEAHRWSAAD